MQYHACISKSKTLIMDLFPTFQKCLDIPDNYLRNRISSILLYIRCLIFIHNILIFRDDFFLALPHPLYSFKTCNSEMTLCLSGPLPPSPYPILDSGPTDCNLWLYSDEPALHIKPRSCIFLRSLSTNMAPSLQSVHSSPGWWQSVSVPPSPGFSIHQAWKLTQDDVLAGKLLLYQGGLWHQVNNQQL